MKRNVFFEITYMYVCTFSEFECFKPRLSSVEVMIVQRPRYIVQRSTNKKNLTKETCLIYICVQLETQD